MKNASLLATFAVATLIGVTARAEIMFTGGVADLTFYYESAADRWDVVLQRKGAGGVNTQGTGTGMTTTYNGFTGIVGNNTALDRTFTSLTTNISTDKFVNVGSTNYAVSRASGSPFFGNTLATGSTLFPTTTSPDMGLRTRLRENQVVLGTPLGDPVANQFDSFNLTLDPLNSTFNGGALVGNANVSLLHWTPLLQPVALIDTAANSLTANFSNWAHVHRNWGFSQSGEYDLAFEINGVGGTYGATASTGIFNMAFDVTAVPEPATTALIAAGFGCLAVGRRFRRKNQSSEPVDSDTLAAIS